jgi:hypothetical protein
LRARTAPRILLCVRAWHFVVVGALAVLAFVVFGGVLERGGDEAETGVTSLAIGIPSQAAVVQAQSDLRRAIAAAEAFRTEHGGYAGMTIDALRGYDTTLASNVQLARADSSGYCVFETVTTTGGSATYSARGGAGSAAVVAGGC